MESQPPIDVQRRVRIVRLSLILMLAILALGCLLILRNFSPTENSFYPGCVLNRLTGIHCTGCGLTRSLHTSLNGDFEQSFAWHPLAILVLPFLAVCFAQSLLSWAFEWPLMPRRQGYGKRLLQLFAVVLVTFTIARNLPWYPCTLLAPHELQK